MSIESDPQPPYADFPPPQDEDPEAGSPGEEIEITAEMEAAGLAALYESGAVENRMEGPDRNLVSRVFLLMWKAQTPPSE